jgi:hypothetical protein
MSLALLVALASTPTVHHLFRQRALCWWKKIQQAERKPQQLL